MWLQMRNIVSSQFLDNAGSALSTSMCRAFYFFWLFALHLMMLLSIAQYLKAMCTPVVSQIWLFSAFLSNLSAKNISHPNQVIFSACWSWAGLPHTLLH